MARKLIIMRWMAVAVVASQLGALPAYGQTEGEKVLLDKARSLESRGNLDLAAQDYRQVLLSDPNNTEALAGVAKADMVAGRAEEARAYLDRLRSVSPNDPRIEQIETMQKQRAASPQMARAGKLAESGQYAQAMTLYRQAYGTNPPAGDIALAYYETEAATADGREHAIAGLRSLANAHPEDTRYEITLGRILTYNPKTRAEGIALLEKHPEDGQANEAVRQALTWDSANPATAGAIRNFLKRHPDKDLEAKLEETESKRVHTTSEFAHNADERAAYAALAANDLPLAEQRFQALRDKQPNNPRVLAGFGFLRMKENNFTAAVDFLEQAEANGDKTAAVRAGLATAQFWATMQRGTQALDQNHLELAIAEFRKAVEMRPTNPEAMRGLAGTLLRAQQAVQAEVIYAHLVKVQPSFPEGWRGLFTAQYLSGNPQKALATERSFPTPVRTALANDPEYLSNLAAAYNAVGDVADSQRVLAQALELPFPNNGAGLKPATLLQFGDLLMAARRYEQASGLYRQVIAQDPNNANAYEGLVRAQHELGQDAQALTTVESMPPAVLQASQGGPNFLATLASIYLSQGKLDIAQKFMEDALALSTAGGQPPSPNLELLLAGIYVARGNSAAAYSLYQQVLSADPGRLDAWRGLISALHSTDRDRDAMAELRVIPADVMRKLQQDPQFLQVLGSIYGGVGDQAAALSTIHVAAVDYQRAGAVPPASFVIQYSYLLLNAGDDQGLYLQLMQLGGRNDLTADQRAQVQTIWAVWSVRRANAAAKFGNYHRALQILDAANRAFPDNLDVQKALAGGYQQAGQAKRAEAVYLQMDWTNATASDYHAAIGAALACKDSKQAQTWLENGLKQFPNDPLILQEAAEFEQARGDNPRATAYYKASLDAMGPEDHAASLVRDLNETPTRGAGAVNNPTQELMNALAPLAYGQQPGAQPMFQQPSYLPTPAPAPVPIYPVNNAPRTQIAENQQESSTTTTTHRRTRARHGQSDQIQQPQQQPQQNVERLGQYNPPQSALTPADECALTRMAGVTCDVVEQNNSGWTVKNAAWHTQAAAAQQPATTQQGDTEIHVPLHARLRKVPQAAASTATAAATAPAPVANVAPTTPMAPTTPTTLAATAQPTAAAAQPAPVKSAGLAQKLAQSPAQNPAQKPAQNPAQLPGQSPAQLPAQKPAQPLETAQVASAQPEQAVQPKMHLHLRISSAAVASAAVNAPDTTTPAPAAVVAAAAVNPPAAATPALAPVAAAVGPALNTTPAPEPAITTPPSEAMAPAEPAQPAQPTQPTPSPAFLAESVKPAPPPAEKAEQEMARAVEEVPGIRYAPTAQPETFHKAQYQAAPQQFSPQPNYPDPNKPQPGTAQPAAPAESGELPPPPPQQAQQPAAEQPAQPEQQAAPAQPQQPTQMTGQPSPYPAYQAAPAPSAQAAYASSPLPGSSSSQQAGAQGVGTYSQAAGQPYNPGYGPGYTNLADSQVPVQQQPYFERRLPSLTGSTYGGATGGQQQGPSGGPLNQRDQIQEQLAALQGGYSPWLGATAIVSYRSGTPGFDRFVIFQTPIEASGVINDSVRATIIARPVIIDSGTPVASTFVQGTLGAGNIPATQTASGTGGEVQLRSANFGVSAGSTPYGFLVQNFIGSVYARPAGGPITLSFNRDSLVDTQLSFSGLRNTGPTGPDGQNGEVFGGVIANAGEVQYATSNDHSGFYLQGGGQYITGKNVQGNARADGDAGAYWRVAEVPDYGNLTLGMNIFAMHYNHNLRYFSFGQGGYFSPDAYILANIPVTFNGHYGRNVHYRINGSVGVQAFQEDASPYYPLVNDTCNGASLCYPTHDSISGNYLIDAEVAYRMSEHWYAGGFFNANNSRDYNTATGGFFVRYMFRTQSPTEEGPPTGIFPVNGLRPIQVP